MRIVTRLVLALVFTSTAIMVLYGLISLEQRASLLRDALIRETETLGRAAQIVAGNALRDGRLADLNRVLARIGNDPETLVAAVLDGHGRVIAGGPAEYLGCLRDHDALALPGPDGTRGWNLCEQGGRWVALPLGDQGTHIVIGRRATVLLADLATSRRRILVTTLVLAAAAAVAIVVVLRRTLSAPLGEIMRGVRSLGAPTAPVPVRVKASVGELRDLAVAFNEMAERLEGKRKALVRQAEERVALDRRVRQAEKFAALGRLTGGLAHELGTPLNVIEMRAEAIEGSEGAPPDIRRQAREIVAEVDRIAQLVRGLNHVARRHPLDPRPVDLADAAESAATDVRRRREAAGVEITVERTASAVVEGDPTLLRHAIGNLILNAVQAVEGTAGEGWVRVRLHREGGEARLVVEDNGHGIPPDTASRLFEPFFTTRDVGQGTGLGLAISLGIAEEHGGSLVLGPRHGRGVRAVLTLPLAAPVGARL